MSQFVHVDDFDVPSPDRRAADATGSRAGDLLVTGVDHVVVSADDVPTACAEIARASGAPLKRLKEGERGTQGFHRFGDVILEVVERRLVDPDAVGAPGLSLWGFVLSVDNLDATVARLGPDVVGSPRPAVQPGRRIATVRPVAGLGVPVALMTP